MMTDRQFVKSFSTMVFLLVLLMLVLIATGIVIGGSIDEKLKAQTEKYTQQVIAKRTQPTGTLNVGEVAMTDKPQEIVQVAAVADGAGKSVYDTACFICHATGITGAPKPGDVGNWNPRIEKGIETLYTNALLGFQGAIGVMPPKGGNTLLSDNEVKAAVDYLVGLIE